MQERAYRAQNRTLRDAARDLGAARDGPVLMKTLDRIVRISRRAETPLAIDGFAAQLQRRAASDRISGRRTAIARAAAKLRTALARVAAWPPPGKGWRLVRKGLRQTYRKGRHAARANDASPTSASLHEWRKRRNICVISWKSSLPSSMPRSASCWKSFTLFAAQPAHFDARIRRYFRHWPE